MHRPGLANKVLIVIVLLLALAAVLGFILTGVQGNALDALSQSSSNTDDKLNSKKDSLGDQVGEAFQSDGQSGTPGGESETTGDSTASSSSSASVQGAVGGGQAYVNEQEQQGEQTHCSPASADITVGSDARVDDIQSAFSRASSGDTVYLPGDLDLETGPAGLTVPSDVLVASNRGCDGAAGALLYSTEDNTGETPIITLESGSTLAGIRIRGPYPDRNEYDPGGAWDHEALGVDAQSGAEIRNVEVYGFPWIGVRAAGNVYVHHSLIHNNNMDGLGYGVSVSSGQPEIAYNQFHHNRHAIAGSDAGYTAHHNIVTEHPANDHVFDMHDGGTRVEIHHNTFRGPIDDAAEGFTIRDDVPSDGFYANNNWFKAYSEPPRCGESGGAWEVDSDIDHDTACDRLHTSNNAFGETEPGCDIGAPRDSC